jgi:hypothetical protein
VTLVVHVPTTPGAEGGALSATVTVEFVQVSVSEEDVPSGAW